MINKFDVHIEKDEDIKEHKNLYASDVLSKINAIPWNDEYKKCLASDDEYGTFFYVTFVDNSNLEYAFDVELYLFDDDEKNEINNQSPTLFTICYSYQEIIKEKVFFGLFGEKEKIVDRVVYMDPVDFDFTLQCLQAFLRHDHAYLKMNIISSISFDEE